MKIKVKVSTETKTIIPFCIFSTIEQSIDGTVSITISDFSDTLYRAVLPEEEYERFKTIRNEIFDEGGKLCGFTLPNDTEVLVSYNEAGYPIKISSFVNCKEIEYYPDNSVKRILSYRESVDRIYYDLKFGAGEVKLD